MYNTHPPFGVPPNDINFNFLFNTPLQKIQAITDCVHVHWGALLLPDSSAAEVKWNTFTSGLSCRVFFPTSKNIHSAHTSFFQRKTAIIPTLCNFQEYTYSELCFALSHTDIVIKPAITIARQGYNRPLCIDLWTGLCISAVSVTLAEVSAWLKVYRSDSSQ